MKVFELSFRAEVGCVLRVVAKDEDEAIDFLDNVNEERLDKNDVSIDRDDMIQIKRESVEVVEVYDG